MQTINLSLYLKSYIKKVPVTVMYGEGGLKKLNDLLQTGVPEGAKVFIVSNTFYGKNQEFQLLCNMFKEKYGTSVILTESFPATTEWVNKYAKILSRNSESIATLVGVGGGAVMDATKALSVCLSTGLPVGTLMESKESVSRSKQLILVPTINGSGAEISKGAVLINSDSGARINLKADSVFADVAIVDPTLALTADIYSRRLCFCDLISHAFETYMSNKSDQETRKMCVVVLQALLKDDLDMDSLSAQNIISQASLLMGVNLACATTCLPHRLSYALPEKLQTELTHAEAVSFFYPGWFNLLKIKQPDLVKKINIEVGFDVINKILITRSLFGIDAKIKKMNILSNKEFADFIISRLQGNMFDDPSYTSVDDIYTILSYNP